jgi:hypothetical protein
VRRGVTLGLALLRAAGLGALALLVWNPTIPRTAAGDRAPLVLLDASLSMVGYGGRWRQALDTARALAHGGVIWRFGTRVTAFDTVPPAAGASRLAPALAAAAARGGPIVIVTDGAVSDLADLPVDLLHRARLVVLPRVPFFDVFIAAVEGPRRVSVGDTIRLKVSYGAAGPRGPGGPGTRPQALLTVSADGRRLAAHPVTLPDSGIVATELTIPPSRVSPGRWTALAVRLEGVTDLEPRDDARLFLLEVSRQPSVVLLASPPDWDTRFLARAMEDVARVPVKTLVQAEPGGTRWRDAATLAPVSPGEVARLVATAPLTIEAGEPGAFARLALPGAALLWPLGRRQDGDWYVQRPGPSPLAAALAGVVWDSLPPATSLTELASDSAITVALGARLARRGPPRPVVLLSERDGHRRALIAAAGLYRWAFRGGASAEAYRALVAALTDWLLGSSSAGGERFAAVTNEMPNGMPLAWRWTGSGEPRPIILALAAERHQRVDTLRFDAGGGAELDLPPGVYRYVATDGPERGVVAVDLYSDEWRPGAALLASQPGGPGAPRERVALRDRWWLFALAIALFAAEWGWRRRTGLP